MGFHRIHHVRIVAFVAILIIALFPTLAVAQGTIVPLPVDDSCGPAINEAYYLDEMHYEDPSIQVTIEKHHWVKSDCYVARIRIADPSQLRTASAYGFDRKQVAAVVDMAKRMNAVVAINGDYCYYQLNTATCYLVRQGKTYAELMAKGRDMLIIDSKGDLHVLQACDHEKYAAFTSGMDVVNTFSFGPGLVVNGQPLDPAYEAEFNGQSERHQRAAIAQVQKGQLEYIFAVSEGDRESEGGGLTLHEWSDFLMTLGVETAYNLDGGNSTALIFHNEKINAVHNHRHRKISDMIYFASAYQE